MRQLRHISCLLLIGIVCGFSACKSSQQASTARTKTSGNNPKSVVISGNSNRIATPNETRLRSSEKTALSNPASSSSSGYPAITYYGENWNTNHIRLNADPKPTENVALNLLAAGEKFVMPTFGKVLSEFGPRHGSMHTGIDLKLEMDAPVYCAFDGMVRMAKEYAAYGKVVVVRHENGLETVYGHLNTIAVKVNQLVKAGDYLGGGGKTGRASGTHLHFETRFKGEPFNPRLLINIEIGQLNTSMLALSKESYQLYGKNPNVAAQMENATVKASSADSAQKIHIVQKGDTLYNISKRYNTTVADLCKLNKLSESSIIKLGQVLVVQ